MKAVFLKVVSLAFAGTMLVTACSDNDKHESQTLRVLQDNGVFVISGGDIQSLTKGIITYYDYATQAPATLGSFVTAGGSLVDRYDCDVVAYGTKAYVLASVENTVYVYDAKSGQMLTSLSTTAMMDEGSGLGPRRITAATGKIYVSTQGGYVAAIDTASYQLIHTYQAGSRPEGISVAGNYLYVANGDDGLCQSPSISVIDLTTGTSRTITHENIRYPQDVVAIGDAIYYLDLGTVDEASNWQTGNGVYCIQGDSIVKVAEGTAMAVGTVPTDDGNAVAIYTFNLPLGNSYADYWVYNVSTKEAQYFTFTGVDHPCAIGVDPMTGQVLIASDQVRKINKWTTAPDYELPGYVSIYGTDGIEKKRFDCGIRPKRFAFNIGVKYVEI